MTKKIQEKFCPGCGGKFNIILRKVEQKNFIINDGKLTCRQIFDPEISVHLVCQNMPDDDRGSDPYPHFIDEFKSEWWNYLDLIRKMIGKTTSKRDRE